MTQIRAGARARGGWGGARNRADRVSWYVSRQQANTLLQAKEAATASGLPFNRHWTLHYERAGVPDDEGQKFVSNILSCVRRHFKRRGHVFAATWVRENGEGKGAHVHIAMHVPDGINLRNRTQRWVKLAGGHYRKGVSHMRTIGGHASCSRYGGEWYEANANALMAYFLKGVDAALGAELGLERCGIGGAVIGKRVGRTQNLGRH